MKGFTLAVLAGTILLCGCASDAVGPNGQQTVADRSDAQIGSYIKRKPGATAGNASTVDKQALENDRTMGNPAINLPQR